MKAGWTMFALFALVGCDSKTSEVAKGADPTTEAKAALDQFQSLMKAGKKDEAKKLIARDSLKKMEEAGQTNMALAMLGSMDLKGFQTKVEGDKVTFNKAQKSGEMSMSMHITVVKEDGQWKIGD